MLLIAIVISGIITMASRPNANAAEVTALFLAGFLVMPAMALYFANKSQKSLAF
jgi:hypothetical protein